MWRPLLPPRESAGVGEASGFLCSEWDLDLCSICMQKPVGPVVCNCPHALCMVCHVRLHLASGAQSLKGSGKCPICFKPESMDDFRPLVVQGTDDTEVASVFLSNAGAGGIPQPVCEALGLVALRQPAPGQVLSHAYAYKGELQWAFRLVFRSKSGKLSEPHVTPASGEGLAGCLEAQACSDAVQLSPQALHEMWQGLASSVAHSSAEYEREARRVQGELACLLQEAASQQAASATETYASQASKSDKLPVFPTLGKTTPQLPAKVQLQPGQAEAVARLQHELDSFNAWGPACVLATDLVSNPPTPKHSQALSDTHRGTARVQGTDESWALYRHETGLQVFLHPFTLRVLLRHAVNNGSQLPERISASAVSLEVGVVTPELVRRMPTMGHLPGGTRVALLDLDVRGITDHVTIKSTPGIATMQKRWALARKARPHRRRAAPQQRGKPVPSGGPVSPQGTPAAAISGECWEGSVLTEPPVAAPVRLGQRPVSARARPSGAWAGRASAQGIGASEFPQIGVGAGVKHVPDHQRQASTAKSRKGRKKLVKVLG